MKIESVQQKILRFGGLGISACLTISLFLRLFGYDVYGIVMAALGLALFEGGAIIWGEMHTRAKHGQRFVVATCQWFCVVASVLSSGAEIIMATSLWRPAFDMGFTTLAIIVAALGVNVIGVILFEQLDPVRAAANEKADRDAAIATEKSRQTAGVIQQALLLTDEMQSEIVKNTAHELAKDIKSDAIAEARNAGKKQQFAQQGQANHAQQQLPPYRQQGSSAPRPAAMMAATHSAPVRVPPEDDEGEPDERSRVALPPRRPPSRGGTRE